MRKKIIIPLLITLAISGCNNPFASAPECSDKSVKDLVITLYGDIVKQSKDNPLTNIFAQGIPSSLKSVNTARSTDYNKDILLRSCRAEGITDNGIEISIKYTVQFLKEENDFMVELDSDFLEGLMQKSIMDTISKMKK
jgi:hypothetical protein|tara:strand:+ start:10564 stop:10980 length:417 start_codon:yes stop_codon:yes gene_type:complete